MDDTGLEPVTPCTSTASSKFFQYFLMVYRPIHYISLAFRHSLATRFPPISQSSVATCVVKPLGQLVLRSSGLHKCGQIANLLFCRKEQAAHFPVGFHTIVFETVLTKIDEQIIVCQIDLFGQQRID